MSKYIKLTLVLLIFSNIFYLKEAKSVSNGMDCFHTSNGNVEYIGIAYNMAQCNAMIDANAPKHKTNIPHLCQANLRDPNL